MADIACPRLSTRKAIPRIAEENSLGVYHDRSLSLLPLALGMGMVFFQRHVVMQYPVFQDCFHG